MSKRIVPAFKDEAPILRLLGFKELRDNRNHTAFPEAIIWNDRIVLNPLYHQTENIWETNPAFIMNVAKQLTEVCLYFASYLVTFPSFVIPLTGAVIFGR